MASRAGTQRAHGCCHNGASQPVKEPAEGGRSVECCKSLHVLVPDGAGLPAASSLEIFALPVAGPVFAIALPEVHPHRRGKRPSARVNAAAHKVTAGIFKNT